jgi:hypothetical protein
VEKFRLSSDQHDDSGGFAADAGDCRGGKDAFGAGRKRRNFELRILIGCADCGFGLSYIQT